MKLRAMFKLAFSRAPDISTPEGRSRDRYRRAAKTGLMGLVAQALNIVISLITVPLTLVYLGKERFGLWMALTSFVAFLVFTDFGLGIGLQNALAECHGRDDKERPRAYVSISVLTLGIIFLALLASAFFVLPLLPIASLIKVKSPSALQELLPTAQAVMISFAIGIPAGLVRRMYLAYQEGFIGDAWLAFGRVLALVAVLLAIWMRLSLPALVLCYVALPRTTMFVGALFLFRKRPWLVPSIGACSWSAFSRLSKTGIAALFAQVGSWGLTSGPIIIIANRWGVDAVTPFGLTQKLLSLSNRLLAMVVTPLWPAYGEAKARADWAWIKKTFRRSLKLGYAVQIPAFLLFTFLARQLFRLWLGDEAVPDWWLIMIVNVWYLVRILNICCATALNGLDHLLGQAIYGPTCVFLGLSVMYFLAYRDYSVPVALVGIVAGLAACGLANLIELKWVFRRGQTVQVRNR